MQQRILTERIMRIVVAIEGIDGAGKSSLARFAEELCRRYGQTFTRVGRRNGYVNPAITKLTHVLGREAANLTPQAEMFIRIAREYQRAHLASTISTGVVLLDRFVLSVLALARINAMDVDLISKHLKEIVLRADLHATVFVQCPFETAWSRVVDRSAGPVTASERGQRMMQRIANYMEDDYHHGFLTGQQWLIDNSKTLEDATGQLEDYLLPYFHR
jgi:thymidylate kinase